MAPGVEDFVCVAQQAGRGVFAVLAPGNDIEFRNIVDDCAARNAELDVLDTAAKGLVQMFGMRVLDPEPNRVNGSRPVILGLIGHTQDRREEGQS